MFEHLIRSINGYRTFSDEEVEAFVSTLHVREVAKGEVILRQGEVCQELSFINKGSFIQSYKDEELNEKIVNLFVSNDWVLNHTSFTSQKPSLHDIKAFEASEVFTVDIHQVHALIGKYPSFFALGKVLEVSSDFDDRSPDEKYQLLLDQKPLIVQTFPLKCIASYLGMTPETLSRVRSRIT